MPLKKKLFRSNMLFLFLSMVTLLLIGTAVIGACEDRFERTFEEIGYEKMDRDVWDISKDIGKEAIRESFSFLVLIVLVVGIIAILALLLLASIFTKRMNRLVMEPLDCLVEGASTAEVNNGVVLKRSYMKDRKSSNGSAVRSMRCRGQFWKIRRYGNGMKRQGQIW